MKLLGKLFFQPKHEKQMEINFRMNLARSYSFENKNVWDKNHIIVITALCLALSFVNSRTNSSCLSFLHKHLSFWRVELCLMAVKMNNAAHSPFVSVAAAVVVVVDYF